MKRTISLGIVAIRRQILFTKPGYIPFSNHRSVSQAEIVGKARPGSGNTNTITHEQVTSHITKIGVPLRSSLWTKVLPTPLAPRLSDFGREKGPTTPCLRILNEDSKTVFWMRPQLQVTEAVGLFVGSHDVRQLACTKLRSLVLFN
jgi:hypothetical protein